MRIADARVRLDSASGSAGTPERARRTDAGGVAGDRIELSDTARTLAGLRAALGSLDHVREERVAGLRPVVGTGRYQIATDAVARDFLVDELGGLLA